MISTKIFNPLFKYSTTGLHDFYPYREPHNCRWKTDSNVSVSLICQAHANFKPGCIAMRPHQWSNSVSFFTFFPICEWLTGVLSDNYHAQAGSRSQKRMHTQRRCKNSTIDLCSFTAHFPHGLAKRRHRLTIKISRRCLAKEILFRAFGFLFCANICQHGRA